MITVESQSKDLPSLGISDTEDVEQMFEREGALWASHPNTLSFLTDEKPKVINNPLMDVGRHVLENKSLFASNRDKLSDREDLTQPYDPPIPSKDIGYVPVVSPPELPYSLESSEQLILQQVKDVIGDSDASEFQLQFVPRWVLEKAINAEKDNYKPAYEEVDFKDLPRGANIVSSHHFFQVKNDGEGERLKLKCRLVPHGNIDRDKDKVRKDSATAQFPIIRIVLSIAALLGMMIASIDIKGAYLQAGSFPREIYVRPPKGWGSSSRKVWRLLKPAYGIAESGRLWQLVVERWMNGQGIYQIPGLPQLFVKRRKDGLIALVIAKVVNDFLLVGRKRDIKDFHQAIAERFTVGRFLIDQDFIFNRLHIHQAKDGSVYLNMKEYRTRSPVLTFLDIAESSMMIDALLLNKKEYLGLTGSLNFLGHGILPQAAFAASSLQQSISRLKVSDLVNANKALAEIKSLSPTLTSLAPSSLDKPSYLSFSDASQGKTSYGQTGYISGIYLPAGGDHIYHVIDWLSCKQSRVSFSSIGAEILAAATSTDRGSLMSERLQELYHAPRAMPFILTVDSNGLYSTVTTLHEGADYRLRPTVARLRDSYENGEISLIQWIPGRENLADALTKRNVDMFRKLNRVMDTGMVDIGILERAKRITFAAQENTAC